ncbi:Uncharacterized protein BM_BM3310 [Brugia malayi]|uniref:Bm7114 n=2 Tax=Brugia TaxID=6278 RepID=A0A4E9FLY0_BRUMA|nr:Uncharacterized protein BM_BM3310 [Brugia malayi]VIO97971.1 Uncharacterized protein BM_BM3310 [Brugia malayi]
MISFLIKQLLLLTLLSLAKVVFGNEVTEFPFNYRTGKLNQFVGFATPHSPPPTNGPFIYGSVWASWSAWSFCVNKVRVRVRACNTVRGFSCLGKKQEFMECDLDYMQPAVQESDYTAVDPWEEDRKEAMKQLYSHKYSSDQSEKVNSDENKNKFIPRESEIRRRERVRVTTKESHNDYQSMTQEAVLNDKQITSTLATTRDFNTKTIGQSLSPSLSNAIITTDMPLSSNTNKQQQQKQHPSESLDQIPVPASIRRQSPVASESSLMQSVHRSPQISHLSDGSKSAQFDQNERSVLFTATERILIDEHENEPILSVNDNEMNTAAIPSKVLVWMPPGITTWISHETTNANDNFPNIITTTTTTSNNLLNSIKSKTFISEMNKISSLSTTIPITTTNTMKMSKVEAKIPSNYHSSISIPIAKALTPIDKSEAMIRRNEFTDDKTQSAFPESNTLRLKSLKIHSNPVNIKPKISNYGISLKKFDQLEEDQQGLSSFDILPEHVITDNNNLKYAPRKISDALASASKTYVADQSRKILQNGNFHQASDNDRAAADKALDLLLKAMSSDDDDDDGNNNDNIDQPTKKSLPNKNLYVKESSNTEIELEEINKNVESSKSLKKTTEELNKENNNKMESHWKAMNLNLVPRGPLTSTFTPTTAPTVIDQSRIFLVSMNENATSNWSEWTNWQRCFCGKQIRTRVCHYETSFLVKGCQGKSYESRECYERDHCPTTIAPVPTRASFISTNIESKIRKSPLHQPLSTATAQKTTDLKERYFSTYNISSNIGQMIAENDKLR